MIKPDRAYKARNSQLYGPLKRAYVSSREVWYSNIPCVRECSREEGSGPTHTHQNIRVTPTNERLTLSVTGREH